MRQFSIALCMWICICSCLIALTVPPHLLENRSTKLKWVEAIGCGGLVSLLGYMLRYWQQRRSYKADKATLQLQASAISFELPDSVPTRQTSPYHRMPDSGSSFEVTSDVVPTS